MAVNQSQVPDGLDTLRHVVAEFNVKERDLLRQLDQDFTDRGVAQNLPKVGQAILTMVEYANGCYIVKRLCTECLQNLTPTQRKVALFHQDGCRRSNIAKLLDIEEGTVDKHLAAYRSKCRVDPNFDFLDQIRLYS